MQLHSLVLFILKLGAHLVLYRPCFPSISKHEYTVRHLFAYEYTHLLHHPSHLYCTREQRQTGSAVSVTLCACDISVVEVYFALPTC